jgi:hypothetical protein
MFCNRSIGDFGDYAIVGDNVKGIMENIYRRKIYECSG